MQKVNSLAITMNCRGSLTKQQLQELNGGVQNKHSSRKPVFNFKVSAAGKIQFYVELFGEQFSTNTNIAPL